MVLQDGLIVVAERLRVTHGDQERIVNTPIKLSQLGKIGELTDAGYHREGKPRKQT